MLCNSRHQKVKDAQQNKNISRSVPLDTIHTVLKATLLTFTPHSTCTFKLVFAANPLVLRSLRIRVCRFCAPLLLLSPLTMSAACSTRKSHETSIRLSFFRPGLSQSAGLPRVFVPSCPRPMSQSLTKSLLSV